MPSDLFRWLDGAFVPSMVCNVEDEGGGDAGVDGGDDSGDAGGDAPSDDDRFNAIATSHVKRAVSGMSKKTQDMIAESLAPMMDQMSQMAETIRNLQGGGDGSKDGKDNKKPDPAFERELKKRDRELEELRAKIEASEAEKQAILEKERAAKEANTLAEALSRHGITGTKARAAAALLKADGLVTMDESGQVLFREKASGYLGEDEFFDLDEGLKKWADGDGKEFLPPRGVQGSGSGGTKTQQGKTRRAAAPGGSRKDALAWADDVLSNV